MDEHVRAQPQLVFEGLEIGCTSVQAVRKHHQLCWCAKAGDTREHEHEQRWDDGDIEKKTYS